MKPSNISFFSFAVWCFLSISAYSQLVNILHYEDPPSCVVTLEELRRDWLRTHYAIYAEDISNRQYTESVKSWLEYLFDQGSIVPFYYIVTTQHVSSVSSGSSIGQLSNGLEFVGAWPVFLLYGGEFVSPEWCSVRQYLNVLHGFQSAFLDSLVASWEYYYSKTGKPNFGFYDDTPGEWSVRFRVDSMQSKSKISFVLPVTRLYLMLPYYPSWWAEGGGYYAVDYDDALMLRGPYLGDDAPWADYDGYVLFSTNRVKVRQVYKWSSPQ